MAEAQSAQQIWETRVCMASGGSRFPPSLCSVLRVVSRFLPKFPLRVKIWHSVGWANDKNLGIENICFYTLCQILKKYVPKSNVLKKCHTKLFPNLSTVKTIQKPNLFKKFLSKYCSVFPFQYWRTMILSVT